MDAYDFNSPENASVFDAETLAVLDTISYAEETRDEMESMNAETRALLDSICAEIENVAEDFIGDIGDLAADLDEILH